MQLFLFPGAGWTTKRSDNQEVRQPRGWTTARVKSYAFTLFLYLFLHAVDFRPQPLDVAVELGDLLLGGTEVIPMPACRSLQLFVLSQREEQPVKVKYIGFRAKQNVGMRVFALRSKRMFSIPN